MIHNLRSHPVYRFLVWTSFCVIAFLGMVLAFRVVTSPDWLRLDDFVEYWAAGQLNFQGMNPYDPELLLPLQLQAGRSFGVPVMMWNPPWMLALVMPFGVIGYPLSRALWLFSFLFITFLTSQILWTLYSGPKKFIWAGWLLSFTFTPILQAMKTGQTGLLLLLGVVGFILFISKKKDFLAGLAISLLIVKPHLLYLFGFFVVLWIIRERRWNIIWGTAFSWLVGSLIALSVNPQVFSQYLFAAQNYPPDDWASPTIGGFLRLLINSKSFWLQFVGPFLGFLWGVYFWIENRKSWDWLERAPLVILASTFTAPYGWTSDQSVALVAVIQIAVVMFTQKWSLNFIPIILGYLVIDVFLFLYEGNQIYLWWFAPSLLLWYIISRRILLSSQERTLNIGF